MKLRRSRHASVSAAAPRGKPRTGRAHARASLALAALALAALLSGCGTTHPPPLPSAALVEAQTFPYYKLYWAGPRFAGSPLVAVDGLKSYSAGIGDSVYYGDCVSGKGLLGGGGSCLLPLQVSTVIYGLHSNSALGAQRNILVRGVPATIFNEEHAIELYSGRTAIDVFSNSLTHALLAASELRPLNAPGSASGSLPPPAYCPGLYGPESPQLHVLMQSLPGRPCQKAQAALAAEERLERPSSSH